MPQIKAYGVLNADQPLGPLQITRRDTGDHDVAIDIAYCGVCHSDIHQVRNEWGNSIYPMVPGHEIVGTVTAVGARVKRFKIGDKVGVGCMVDSCRECPDCKEGLEQFCGGRSLPITALKKTIRLWPRAVIPPRSSCIRILSCAFPKIFLWIAAAPLLCAGITTYSPLRHWKAGPGKRVAIIGLGGLGHMAVKIAHAMKAEVTVLTRTLDKKDDAKRLGADHVYATGDRQDI